MKCCVVQYPHFYKSSNFICIVFDNNKQFITTCASGSWLDIEKTSEDLKERWVLFYVIEFSYLRFSVILSLCWWSQNRRVKCILRFYLPNVDCGSFFREARYCLSSSQNCRRTASCWWLCWGFSYLFEKRCQILIIGWLTFPSVINTQMIQSNAESGIHVEIPSFCKKFPIRYFISHFMWHYVGIVFVKGSYFYCIIYHCWITWFYISSIKPEMEVKRFQKI